MRGRLFVTTSGKPLYREVCHFLIIQAVILRCVCVCVLLPLGDSWQLYMRDTRVYLHMQWDLDGTIET